MLRLRPVWDGAGAEHCGSCHETFAGGALGAHRDHLISTYRVIIRTHATSMTVHGPWFVWGGPDEERG